MNLFLRWEYGPQALSAIPGMIFSRMVSNGQTFVMTDFPAFAFYKPNEAKLAEVKANALVLASTATPPWWRVMCNWAGEHIHAEVAPFLGGHAPFLDHPLEMAEALRECL
jgi:hypothetical protein